MNKAETIGKTVRMNFEEYMQCNFPDEKSTTWPKTFWDRKEMQALWDYKESIFQDLLDNYNRGLATKDERIRALEERLDHTKAYHGETYYEKCKELEALQKQLTAARVEVVV